MTLCLFQKKNFFFHIKHLMKTSIIVTGLQNVVLNDMGNHNFVLLNIYLHMYCVRKMIAKHQIYLYLLWLLIKWKDALYWNGLRQFYVWAALTYRIIRLIRFLESLLLLLLLLDAHWKTFDQLLTGHHFTNLIIRTFVMEECFLIQASFAQEVITFHPTVLSPILFM